MAKMAAKKALLCIAFMAALAHITMAANYDVGGASGWDTTTDLAGWAATIKFVPGDTLTFTYPGYHNVLEVSESEYDSCSATKPLASYTDGTTIIKLTAPGKRYFICGIPGHCSLGMKLEVDVASSAKPSLPAPAPKAASTPAPIAPPTRARHKHAHAPTKAASPAPAPTLPPTTTAPSTTTELPPISLTAPAPAPAMKSAAVGQGQKAAAAIGLGVGLLMVLGI